MEDHSTFCTDHDHNHEMSVIEKEFLSRWPRVFRELSHLLDRIKDIRKSNSEPLPYKINDIEKKSLSESLLRAILIDERPELKRNVARRMANRIAEYLLWRRESSIPVIHELIVLLPWWISQAPFDAIKTIRDLGLNYIINGQVVPIQTVWKDLLSASLVYMGHCVCRSSGVVNDLRHNELVINFLCSDESKILLDRFINKYRSLMNRFGLLPDTDPHFISICQKLSYMQSTGSRQYCLETLLEMTYPTWELLPVVDKYTQTWIRSLHLNKKAHAINKELAFEFANIQYLARGTIFTSMKMLDTPYTICSCPTPENDGGCVLTNWYYYGRSNTSILPNETQYGRRKDMAGNILPCKYFVTRGERECIGCGCKHQASEPRSFKMILNDADDVLKSYKI